MSAISPRVGFILPDDNDFVLEDDFNANSTLIDKSLGMVWVTDGTLPEVKFHGAIFKELTSGKEYILKSDGLGGFTKIHTGPAVPYGRFTASGSIPRDTPTNPGHFSSPGGNTLGSPDVTVGVTIGNININTPGIYLSTLSVVWVGGGGATISDSFIDLEEYQLSPTLLNVRARNPMAPIGGTSAGANVTLIARCTTGQTLRLAASCFWQGTGPAVTCTFEVRMFKLDFV